MSLKIHSVENSNDPNHEFVRLTTTVAINMKGYALIDKTFDLNGEISNEFRHIYIFPDLILYPGEYLRLYTGKGDYKGETHDTQGHNIHFLYWNSEECVWNDQGGDTATLIKISVVDSKKVPPVKKK